MFQKNVLPSQDRDNFSLAALFNIFANKFVPELKGPSI